MLIGSLTISAFAYVSGLIVLRNIAQGLATALAWAVILIRRRRFTTLAIEREDWPRLVIGAVVGYSSYQLCSVFDVSHDSIAGGAM